MCRLGEDVAGDMGNTNRTGRVVLVLLYSMAYLSVRGSLSAGKPAKIHVCRLCNGTL